MDRIGNEVLGCGARISSNMEVFLGSQGEVPVYSSSQITTDPLDPLDGLNLSLDSFKFNLEDDVTLSSCPSTRYIHHYFPCILNTNTTFFPSPLSLPFKFPFVPPWIPFSIQQLHACFSSYIFEFLLSFLFHFSSLQPHGFLIIPPFRFEDFLFQLSTPSLLCHFSLHPHDSETAIMILPLLLKDPSQVFQLPVMISSFTFNSILSHLLRSFGRHFCHNFYIFYLLTMDIPSLSPSHFMIAHGWTPPSHQPSPLPPYLPRLLWVLLLYVLPHNHGCHALHIMM